MVQGAEIAALNSVLVVQLLDSHREIQTNQALRDSHFHRIPEHFLEDQNYVVAGIPTYKTKYQYKATKQIQKGNHTANILIGVPSYS